MRKLLLTFGIVTLLAACKSKNEAGKIGVDTGLNESPANARVSLYQLYATAQNFEQLRSEGKLLLVTYGLISHDYSAFEEKYGIRIKSENCVIPPSAAPVTENNLLIAAYLTQEYGDGWKNELPLLPLGIAK